MYTTRFFVQEWTFEFSKQPFIIYFLLSLCIFINSWKFVKIKWRFHVLIFARYNKSIFKSNCITCQVLLWLVEMMSFVQLIKHELFSVWMIIFNWIHQFTGRAWFYLVFVLLKHKNVSNALSLDNSNFLPICNHCQTRDLLAVVGPLVDGFLWPSRLRSLAYFESFRCILYVHQNELNINKIPFLTLFFFFFLFYLFFLFLIQINISLTNIL